MSRMTADLARPISPVMAEVVEGGGGLERSSFTCGNM